MTDETSCILKYLGLGRVNCTSIGDQIILNAISNKQAQVNFSKTEICSSICSFFFKKKKKVTNASIIIFQIAQLLPN